MKNGIMVGGYGLSIGELRDGAKGMNKSLQLCDDQLVTTGIYPDAIRGSFKDAGKWLNLTSGMENALEMEFKVQFPGAARKPSPATWYILVQKTGSGGYDRATLSPERDFKAAFCTLKVGEWSPKITTDIKMPDGSLETVLFRCKLLELSDDAEAFRLYISSMTSTTGWSWPPEVAEKMSFPESIVALFAATPRYEIGWIDLDTYVEISHFYTGWLSDAAAFLLENYGYDAFFMHAHAMDWAYHALISSMDPVLTPDPQKREKAWQAHLRILQDQDEMIARILQVAGKGSLTVLVSDHGSVPDGLPFNPYQVLVEAGLADPAGRGLSNAPRLKRQAEAREMLAATAQKPTLSKAVPLRTCYVYINLKGRDPEGIVEPGDYEKVQQQVIDALLCYVDPSTGKRPVALALSNKDARILGLYGDSIGDVVYAIYPEFGGQHGPLLPTASFGPGSVKGLLVFNGPGIKKGFQMQRTARLPDIVPTLCYVMNWPLPEDAEGCVLYQALSELNPG